MKGPELGLEPRTFLQRGSSVKPDFVYLLNLNVNVEMETVGSVSWHV